MPLSINIFKCTKIIVWIQIIVNFNIRVICDIGNWDESHLNTLNIRFLFMKYTVESIKINKNINKMIGRIVPQNCQMIAPKDILEHLIRYNGFRKLIFFHHLKKYALKHTLFKSLNCLCCKYIKNILFWKRVCLRYVHLKQYFIKFYFLIIWDLTKN